MRVGFVTFRDYYRKNSGSSRLRADYMVRNWPEAELYRKGINYDVLVLQKVYDTSFAGKAKITILDLCDYDDKKISRIIDDVDIVTCASQALCERYGGYLIHDRFDLELIKHRKVHHEGPPRSIIWYGYSKHGKILLPDYFDVIQECSLDLTIMSDKKPSFKIPFKWYKWPVDLREPDMSEAHEIIISSDIVLNPRLNPFKSDNKTHQSWLLNMPVAFTPEDVRRLSMTSAVERQITIDRSQYDIRISIEQFKELIKSYLKLNKDKINLSLPGTE